ncbi:hypothetical protein Fleli_1311 [Bernardetia litoralis DSM 6794]|uniref:Uncharacterized protein n=1 Tax=Bernardetia litoralis (strain ATCC 23117 / DSM 6794 / NBRC 15988 / NCIMB 1366 / Fx l1 / Sio-4) TaxID=880071 RepID=I4AIF8_BERLS|nr:hypothetical protein [Bernardetia litoralis]AFM03743.1 hypothetical protein Fleli_1311 [Bernardetia litoralis DSM 6794]
MFNPIRLSLLITFLSFFFIFSSCTETVEPDITEPETPNPSSEIYTGNICFKRSDCNYIVMCLNDSGYVLIDDYFDACEEGDMVEIKLNKFGYKVAYNLTQNKNIKIYVDNLEFSEDIALEKWEEACQTNNLYKEKGVVCFKNPTCDYIIVCLDNGKYSVVKDYANICEEGDILIGRFEDLGIDYVYNITQNKTFSINVNNLEISETTAREEQEDACQKNELYKDRGTICFKSTICDYMIVCLDNGYYSVIKEYTNTSQEGDILVGEFQGIGDDYAYNITQETNIEINIKTWQPSERRAMEEWEDVCKNNDELLQNGTVCLKTSNCDYMIICLDNGYYSLTKDYHDICQEGDLILGKFTDNNFEEAYNFTRSRTIRIYVEATDNIENNAVEKWNEKCD